MDENLKAGGLLVCVMFILSLVFCNGCSQTTGTLGGAAIGTGAGAGVGYAIGGKGGAVLGGVLGGLAGGAIGSHVAEQSEADDRDYAPPNNTQSAELEIGRQRRELERQRLEMERERLELERKRQDSRK
jgi:hypothetical protein